MLSHKTKRSLKRRTGKSIKSFPFDTDPKTQRRRMKAAVLQMRTALEDQRARAGQFQNSARLLEEKILALKASLLTFGHNRDQTQVKRAGRAARNFVKIMEQAEAGAGR